MENINIDQAVEELIQYWLEYSDAQPNNYLVLQYRALMKQKQF